jgi:ABC-type antimicrobial peptide transport system permease subunit
MATDTGYWKVFEYRFLEGKPFSGADFLSGLRKAVISRSMADRLFGGGNPAVGKYFSLNFLPYQVTGVVQDVSKVMRSTYSDIWLPYTLLPAGYSIYPSAGMVGQHSVFILAPTPADVSKVSADITDSFQRYMSRYADEWELSLMGQPYRQWQAAILPMTMHEPDWTMILLRYGLIVLALMLVPAISLSGMTDSRVERRLPELGVRRAFGARRGTLMMQVISENLLFTLLGGLLGLLLSYSIVYLTDDWIMNVLGTPADVIEDGAGFRPSMLLNFSVFGMAFITCLVLNVLSAFIPAWKAARREIVRSLNF